MSRARSGHPWMPDSPELYRLLVESATEYAIFMIGPDGRIASWNSGAERIFGYTEDEAVGLEAAELFEAEDRASGVPQAELETVAREGRASDDRWHVRKDGSHFFANGVTEAVRSDDGKIQGFVKLLRDNTERQRAEDALRQLNETLEAQVRERTDDVRKLASQVLLAEQRERDRIARILHDDVQQALHALNIRIRSLALQHGIDRDDEDYREAVETMRSTIESARSLSAMIHPPVLQRGSLADALRWLSNHMQEWHDLTVDVRIDLDGSDDLEELGRVLVFHSVRELLFNVVKHAGVQSARLSARRDADQLIVELIDRGAGFDVGQVLDRDHGGLGLRTIRERLRFHGGDLEIESAPGEGTRKTLRIPLAPQR